MAKARWTTPRQWWTTPAPSMAMCRWCWRVSRLPADTIVIHGEHDEVISLAQVLDWARPQSLPVVVFPGVGHFFHGKLVLLQQYVQRLVPSL